MAGPPRRSSRPLANPDLFKPTPPRPQSGNGRRVSFQDGPPEEIGVQQRGTSSPDPNKRPSSGASGRSSKWQPLSAVDPNPVGDHDPFSLGDSDDEDAKKKDSKSEDGGKVEKATAEAMTDDIGSSREKTEPHVRSGDTATGNQGADELSGKATG